MVKNPPEMWETQVQFLCQEGPLEEEMATYSSIHASEIPWTEEPGGHSPWSLKESEMNEQLAIYPCCSIYESLVPFQNLCPTALKTGGKSGPPLPSSPL